MIGLTLAFQMWKVKTKALESRVEKVILPTRITFSWILSMKAATLSGSVSEVEDLGEFED